MVKQKRKTVYVAKSTGRTWDTREEAIKDNINYKKDIHYRYSIKAGNYKSPYKNYNIPFIPKKKITLTNAGLATGAVLSTNLLDSIAVNAERAGLPIKTAIGLAAKESTLNNPTYDMRSRAKIATFERSELKKAKELGLEKNIKPKQNIGTGDTPESLLISYNPDDNPYSSATKYILQKAKTWEDNLRMMRENEAYADRQAIRKQAQPSKSYLQAGFEAYKKNPKRYNPGQSNYSQLVDKRGEEVWGSPEVQNWYKTYRKRKFEEGGKIMPKRSLENAGRSTNYVTTGGAGYIPQNNIDIKSRLYENLSPIGYDDLSRVPKAIFLNKPDSYHNTMKDMPVLDEIYAQYLGIPEKSRHFNTRLEKSKYKPTQGGENVTYYKLPQKTVNGRIILGDDHNYTRFSDTSVDEMVFDATYMNPGENKQQLNTELGYYTVGRGRDNKGDYVSYYDKWDINPFSGRLQNHTAIPLSIRKILKDINLDFGVPVNIYDRIHFDDYYGVQGENRGGHYLPEVVVTGKRKKHKDGGIYIKPSKRGTFTAAATKHGMGVQEFASKVLANKENYSPAMVKKANFARNTSKWNH